MPLKKTYSVFVRLSGLDSLRQDRGLSWADVAASAGIPRRALYSRLEKDDMHVKEYCRCFEAMGGRCTFFLTEGEVDSSQLAGLAGLVGSSGNLAFLRFAVRKYEVSVRDVAKRLGVTPAGFYYWLSADDIWLSRLDELVSAMNLHLNEYISDSVFVPNL